MVETFRKLVSDVPTRIRRALQFSVVLVVAFLISLVVRKSGSYSTPIDGWGIDAFEIAVGVVCLSRFLNGTWRSSHSVARAFPLIFGAASLSWAIGDIALTVESLGGATPAVPSVADGFYIRFFPLCFVGLTAPSAVCSDSRSATLESASPSPTSSACSGHSCKRIRLRRESSAEPVLASRSRGSSSS